MQDTTNIDPYSLSTFGRAYTHYLAMKTLAAKPDATASELLQEWSALEPLLGKMMCDAPDSIGAPSFINQEFTGMESAAELGLPTIISATWDRMRVLQGLLMHMQMWVFFGTTSIASFPTSTTADYYNECLGQLINQIADLLECCESLPDELEEWAEVVISQCTEENSEQAGLPASTAQAVTQADQKARLKIAAALGHEGVNFAWSYLIGVIKELVTQKHQTQAEDARDALTPADVEVIDERELFEAAYVAYEIEQQGITDPLNELMQYIKDSRRGERYTNIRSWCAWIGWGLAKAAIAAAPVPAVPLVLDEAQSQEPSSVSNADGEVPARALRCADCGCPEHSRCNCPDSPMNEAPGTPERDAAIAAQAAKGE